MQPERIVVINDTSQPHGGTAGLALRSIREFRARGYPVTLLAGDGGNAELDALGVEVVALGQAPLLERPRAEALRQGIYNAKARNLVAEHIKRNDTPGTVYHLHAWAQILSPSVFSALAPVAARSFVHAHDLFIACPNGVFMDYRKGEVCTRRSLSLACIVTNCDKRAYPHKLWRVVRHATLNRTFDTALPWAGVVQIHPDMQSRLARGGIPAALCRTLRNPADPWSRTRIAAEANDGFLYVGRLEIDKGVMVLAQAARRTGSRVTFIGDGPMRAELQARFPEFPVTGWKNRDEIGAIARTARALVMPSLHPEPFALVLPEAIHSGLPALVADSALMAREIVEGGLGIAFHPQDSRSFDAALAEMNAAAPERLREMSDLGFAGAAPLALSVDDWIAGLIALYQEALLRQ